MHRNHDNFRHRNPHQTSQQINERDDNQRSDDPHSYQSRPRRRQQHHHHHHELEWRCPFLEGNVYISYFRMFVLVLTCQCLILLSIALVGDMILSPHHRYGIVGDFLEGYFGVGGGEGGGGGGGEVRHGKLRMPDCYHGSSKMPLLIGGSDGSGTRAFVDIVKQLGVTVVADDKTTFDVHAASMFRGEGWPALVNRVLKVTHSGNFAWNDLPEKLQQTIAPEVRRLFTNMNNRCATVKSREMRMRHGDESHPTSTTVSYAIKAPVSMLVLPVLAQFIGGQATTIEKRFKFLHVIRDGRDVGLSSNQSPVAKFYNTTYVDYEERSKKYKGNLQRVKAIQLWNDWNIQVYQWATEHSSSNKSSSGGISFQNARGANTTTQNQHGDNEGGLSSTLRQKLVLSSSGKSGKDEDIIVDYLIMRSEDLLDPDRRLECLLKLAEFVGSTIQDDQLCCMSRQKAKDFGESGQHYKDGTPFTSRDKGKRNRKNPLQRYFGDGGEDEDRQHPMKKLVQGFARRQKLPPQGVGGVSGRQQDLLHREEELRKHEHELEEKAKLLERRERDLKKKEAELLARFKTGARRLNETKFHRRRLDVQLDVVGDNLNQDSSQLLKEVQAFERLVATGKETADYDELNKFMARGAELIHLIKRQQFDDGGGEEYEELGTKEEDLARQINALERMAAHLRPHEKKDDVVDVEHRYGKWMAVLANDTELSKHFHEEGALGLELFGYEPRKVAEYKITTTDRSVPLVCSDNVACSDDEEKEGTDGGRRSWFFH